MCNLQIKIKLNLKLICKIYKIAFLVEMEKLNIILLTVDFNGFLEFKFFVRFIEVEMFVYGDQSTKTLRLKISIYHLILNFAIASKLFRSL